MVKEGSLWFCGRFGIVRAQEAIGRITNGMAVDIYVESD